MIMPDLEVGELWRANRAMTAWMTEMERVQQLAIETLVRKVVAEREGHYESVVARLYGRIKGTPLHSALDDFGIDPAMWERRCGG